MGGGLVLAPLFIISAPRINPVLCQALFLQIFTLVLIAMFGVTQTRKTSAMLLFAAFIALVPENPFSSYPAYQLAMVFTGILFIMAIPTNYRIISISLASVCLMQSVWVGLEHLGIDSHREILNALGANISPAAQIKPISGSLGNHNPSSALIAMTMPFIPMLLWPVAFAAILYMGSTMGILSAVVAMVVYLEYSGRIKRVLVKLYALLTALAAIVASGWLSDYGYLGSTGRLPMWKEFIHWMGFSLKGGGLGFVATKWTQHYDYNGLKFYQLHNEWLEAYSIGGIIGVAFMIWLALPCFKNKHPAISACLLAGLFNSLGNFTFHMAPLFIVFGACYSLQIKES